MKSITERDIKALSLGAALLGSGGGGTATFEPLMLTQLILEKGPLRVIRVEELTDEDTVLPLAYMGAPMVSIEKLPNGTECDLIMQNVGRLLGKRPTVLMSAEIGGSNAFTALLLAYRYGLPVLDADLIGRAFPQLEMASAHLAGVMPSPAFVADSLGRSAILEAPDARTIELLARQVTVACGSSAAIGMYLMSGAEARNGVVAGSLSRACILGRLILEAQEKGIAAPCYLAEKADARVVGVGTVSDNTAQTVDGFTTGVVTIEGTERLQVWCKNEFLLVRVGDRVRAATPDIIALIDEETGVPLQTDSIQYGLRVAVITLPAPEIWKSERGLALVGPQAFGFDVTNKELS